ncbi:hypothetical protein Fmac_033004 [Flemingia macrophylla]|uniref:Uncharacterized protein n=1 Tax=Flemingia macrophylla TaxID=520843 RepID=A0ABD1L6Z0_9FABA
MVFSPVFTHFNPVFTFSCPAFNQNSFNPAPATAHTHTKLICKHNSGSADVAFRTPLAPYEKSKSLGSGGSMVVRLKLKGIDGRASPGVELVT